MTSITSGAPQIQTRSVREALLNSVWKAAETSVQSTGFQRFCGLLSLTGMRGQIEKWISAQLADPDMAACVDMSTAINRALRHTQNPERTSLIQRLALAAPRKNLGDSLADLSVLIVHNSGTLSQLTRHILREFSVKNAVEVPDMKTACKAARLNPFDLVITHDQDIAMSSLPLMQRVTSSKAGGRTNLPILLLSARCGASNFAELKQYGVAAFLRAPFDGTSLYRTLLALFRTSPGPEILSVNYCGPSRRSEKNTSTHFTERRRGDCA